MFFPVMINIKNKKIAVVGGGTVALRKVKSFLQYTDNIVVISPEFNEGFNDIEHRIHLIRDEYHEDLIKDAYIVVAATSSRTTNQQIEQFCHNSRILCNVVDDRDNSDILMVSSFKRGDLTVAVSTNGSSPTLASRIKKELENIYGDDYEEYVDLLGYTRELIIKKVQDKNLRKSLLNGLVEMNIDELKKIKESYEGGE